MDIDSLQIFACIVEEGNLSAAARALSMTRSNVSRRLQALEVSVGVPLLRRTTHDVSLTPAGEILYTRARNIVRELVAAKAELSGKSAEFRGRVKVSIPRSLIHVALSPVLTQFSLEHPGVALEVVHTNEITDLHVGRIDIAVHIARRPVESAVVAWRSDVEWAICASPEYIKRHGMPRTLAALGSHSVICYAVRDGVIPLTAVKGASRERISLDACTRTNDLQFARDAACAGTGIGILARYSLDKALVDGSLIELLPEYTFSFNSAKMYLQTLEVRYQTPLARLLAGRIREQLQALALVRLDIEAKTAA